jgi:hypothetical protein
MVRQVRREQEVDVFGHHDPNVEREVMALHVHDKFFNEGVLDRVVVDKL